jgi:tight adherence protein C
MYTAIVILIGSSVMLFILGITMKTERELIRDRVDRFSALGEAMSAPLHPEFAGSFSQRVVRPFLRTISGFAYALTPKGQTTSIDAKLETAGRPWKMGVKEFMGLKTLSIAVFAGMAYIAYRFMASVRPEFAIATAALALLIGYILPDYILQQVIAGRHSKIRKALPDTIDLLTVSVEAGVGFDGAMAKVAEKVKGPLTDELLRALEEMRLGKLRMQALRDMSTRIDMQEVRTFVAALYQAEQLGVSIAKVLKVQGDTMRTRRSQLARELAAKLPVKMVFPLVFFIFPSLFVILLGPAMMEIYKALGQ